MRPKRITYAWLERQQACEDQRMLAGIHFGRSVILTRAVLMEAAALELNMSWLAFKILPESLWADYAAKRASLRADYAAKLASLLADILQFPETL